MLDILFVMDPLATVNPDADTTFDLMLAAHARGHRVYWCEPTALGLAEGHILAHAEQLEPRRGAEGPFKRLQKRELVISEIGATFMRKDPPVDANYLNATLLLWAAHKQGARVYNRPDTLLNANEKLYALSFPAWVPPSLVTSSLADVRAFMATHEHIVLKPLDGNGGRGVFAVKKGDSNLAPMVDALTNEGKRHLIAQRYLPEVAMGDKRIILVNGEIAGAINRVPPSGDHRANMHIGGKAVATEITERERTLCEALKPSLLRDGLLFVGIDVIGGYLTEINVTSPTGVQEIRRLSGVDISPTVIAYIENA
jgi:glutathione synthase